MVQTSFVTLFQSNIVVGLALIVVESGSEPCFLAALSSTFGKMVGTKAQEIVYLPTLFRALPEEVEYHYTAVVDAFIFIWASMDRDSGRRAAFANAMAVGGRGSSAG